MNQIMTGAGSIHWNRICGSAEDLRALQNILVSGSWKEEIEM